MNAPVQIVYLQSWRYVTIELADKLTGYTIKAIEKKIESGVWVEGQEYVRAEDGRILIDMEGYYKWVEKGRRAGLRRKATVYNLHSSSGKPDTVPQ